MLRTIVVIALTLFVVGATLPNAFLPNDAIGANCPISVDARYDITSITPEPVLAGQDVAVGDHIVPQTLSVLGRQYIQTWYIMRPGDSFTFTVVRNGRSHPVTLRQGTAGTRIGITAIVKRSTATIFIVVAAVLLLLRPSPMMWGFFLYALGSAGGGALITEWMSPAICIAVNFLLVFVFYDILGPLGVVMFATRFPTSASSGWRHAIQRWTPAIAVLLLVPALTFAAYMAGVPLPGWIGAGSGIITQSVPTLGIVALLGGFLHQDRVQKQRLRWVVAGFAVYYAYVIYSELSNILPDQGWPPAWTNGGWPIDMLNGLVVFIPITVAYAVLKHHVLDINFVIGRGIVYAILTSFAVAVFAIIEWFVGGVLAQTKLATAGEAIAAIAIGFWLNGLHGRVDQIVDSLIFRRRHLAEQRLRRVAAGLPHAETASSVAEMLVREPVEALGLLSGAFFRRVDDGGFVCASSVGSSAFEGARLAAGDALTIHLNGERGPVFLDSIGWKLPGDHGSARAPVVALPVFVRHSLDGITFYGGHSTGEAIDPDELRVLESLATGASAALDHLEAVELRRLLDESRRAVDALQTRLAAARI